MLIPLRTKGNIKFDPKLGVWKYGKAMGARTAKKTRGAQMLLRTMFVLEFIEDMIANNKSSTLREMYYISEGWGKAKFSSQDESNLLAEDLEIVTKCLREDFKLRPEENGASVIGDLTITEVDRKGKLKRINCRDDVGDSGYTIPYNVEKEKIELIETSAKFVIAIETGGMFDRLVENGFDEKFDALLVHLKGQPARSTRRFIKRLNEELQLPVVVFTDGDPWSFRIFASVAYGAIKTAHISEYLATPTAEFIGITASDIINYDLPTDKLTDMDIRALNAELNDPRFNDEFWRNEIETMLEIGKKAEQQALAKYGLDYVTDTYLPEKLTELGII
jgi:DNA topoisomerase-6 subunit A